MYIQNNITSTAGVEPIHLLQKQWQYGKNGVGDRKDALECRD